MTDLTCTVLNSREALVTSHYLFYFSFAYNINEICINWCMLINMKICMYARSFIFIHGNKCILLFLRNDSDERYKYHFKISVRLLQCSSRIISEMPHEIYTMEKHNFLKLILNSQNMFETGVVRANEGSI